MLERSPNRKSAAYDRLRRDILTNRRPPGSDLDEASLASEFELSRTPLREILRQLAGEGYVVLRENRGAYVSEMSHTALRNFFLAAPMIYAAVAQLAARNATADQIAGLKRAQQDFTRALANGSVEESTLANNHFHAIMGDMADNAYLLPSLNRLLIDHARIGMTFYQPKNEGMSEKLKTASRQHDAFIDAIERRDEVRAGELAHDHWRLSRDHIEMFVMPNPLDLSLDGAR